MSFTVSILALVATAGAATMTASSGDGCTAERSTKAVTANIASANTGTMGAVSLVADAAPADIVDTAVAAGNFNTLAKALTEAGLVSALKGKGPFTVFAPTDAAFAKLPAGTVESLLRPENRDQLISILTYHVVPGEFDAGEVLDADTLTTLNGQRIDIDADKTSVDGAGITATDIECSNGIIHVIDTVIMPKSDSILEIAGSAGSFTTLAAALEAADLIGALEGDGPFTVFAPTDEAFAALPEGTLEMLLMPENKDKLRGILLYHVVEGRVYADQAVKAGKADTLQGSGITIEKSRGKVKVNQATVSKADLEASNGVIHVIDRVILPKD
ncbi:MAG: fasciclin domain-containing protein [Phycisphaerales bacterium]